MSNEQLAEAIKNGENQYTTELWENTYRLLYKLVGEYYAKYGERFTACGVTLEDMQQESYIAFVGMIKAYTPEKGLKFTTYAQLQIKIRIAELLGKRTEKKRPLNMSRSLDEPIQGIDGEDKYIIDTIEDSTEAEAFESTEADIFNTELKNALEKAKILTAAAGVTLGELLRIDYSWGEVAFRSETNFRMAKAMCCDAASGAAAGLSVSPEDIRVEDNATFVWAIG